MDATDPAAEGDRGLLSSSAGHLYQLFRQGRVRTRGELRELTNLSRSTVTPRVDALLAAGFLREQGATASTGRRASVLVPHEEPRTLLVADLGATHGRLAVTDGAGAVLAEARLESRIDTGPEAVLERVFTTFRGLLADAGRDEARVDGVGIGVPGPVDVHTATVVQPPIMPGWHGFDIRGFGARYFAAPIFVENDANLMALGESRHGHPQAPSLLFVKVATGIGAGLVLRGSIYDGVDGGAGDIGHVRVPEAAGRRCDCGAYGCLAAVAGGKALARTLTELGVEAHSSRDVVRLVQHGVPEAVAVTREAGRILGQVLATAVSLLNPAALILGGDMAGTHEHFILGLREAVYQSTQPLATRSLTIAISALGDRAGIIGGCELVRRNIFSAAAVDRALAASGSEGAAEAEAEGAAANPSGDPVPS